MRMFLAFLLSTLVLGCNPSVKPNDLQWINGYWEIEQVELSDGSTRDYPMNETYDYYEFKNSKGIRMKVMPQLNGTFRVNPNVELFTISNQNDEFFLNYKTEMTQWKEELILLTKDKMTVKSTNGNVYHYKKTGAIDLTNGKKK